MSDHHKSKPEHICVETLDLDKNKPEILKAEIVAESRLFKVESLHLKFSNGEERVYERMRGGNRGAVMVVPLFDAHTLLLVMPLVSSLELGAVTDALGHLVYLNLVDSRGDLKTRRYTIHNLTATFLQEQVIRWGAKG